MPAFARAILIQESAEGGLSYKVKKQKPDSAKPVFCFSSFTQISAGILMYIDVPLSTILSI